MRGDGSRGGRSDTSQGQGPPPRIPWPAGSSAEAVAPGAAGVWGWEDEYASSPVSLVRLKEGHQVREKVKDSRGKFLKESF